MNDTESSWTSCKKAHMIKYRSIFLAASPQVSLASPLFANQGVQKPSQVQVHGRPPLKDNSTYIPPYSSDADIDVPNADIKIDLPPINWSGTGYDLDVNPSIHINGKVYETDILTAGSTKIVYNIIGTGLVFKFRQTKWTWQPFSDKAYKIALEKNLVVPEYDVSPEQDRRMLISQQVTSISDEFYRNNEKLVLNFYKKFRDAKLYLGDARAPNIAIVNNDLKLLDTDFIFPFDEAGGSDFTDKEIYDIYKEDKQLTGIRYGVYLPGKKGYLPPGEKANFTKIYLRVSKFHSGLDLLVELLKYYSIEEIEAEADKMMKEYWEPQGFTAMTLPNAFKSLLNYISRMTRRRI